MSNFDRVGYMRDYMREYRRTDKYKVYHRQLQAEWAVNNPMKIKAHSYLNGRVKSGKIIRPSVCEGCRQASNPQAHHHRGYKREHWLDVVWLCEDCHKEARSE